MSLNRRRLLGAMGAGAVAAGIVPTSVLARGRGRGRGNRDDGLVNVDVVDGALVATGDGFVIDGQSVDAGDIELHDGEHVIDCGAYSGTISNTEITVPADLGSGGYGINAAGGRVDVVETSVSIEEGLSHQFVSVSYTSGGTGTVDRCSITGTHRVGVLVRGEGSDATVRRTEVVGTGPTVSGSAENGIQVDEGATATVQQSTVADHWWDVGDWASTGILALSDRVSIQQTELTGNNVGAWSLGDDVHLNGNAIDVSHPDATFPGFDGIILEGSAENRVVNNHIVGDDEAYSGILLWGAVGSKLIRNRIEGFQAEIDRFGDEETLLPRPFDPAR